MARTSSSLKSMFVGVGLVSTALFWSAFAVHGQLQTRRIDALRQVRPMFALSGVTVRFDRHLEPSLQTGGPRTRYLLLISSDRCPYSQKAVEPWRAMLSDIPLGDDDQVLLLSAFGFDIPRQLNEALAQRHIVPRIVTIRDPLGFAQETGFGVTPITAVLDSHMAIRLVSSRLTQVFLKELRQYFSGGVQ